MRNKYTHMLRSQAERRASRDAARHGRVADFIEELQHEGMETLGRSDLAPI